MAKIVDARGLACPQPVILTRDALKEAAEVITIVDNETARANVIRLAEQTGATVKVEQKEDGIYLHITKEPTAHAEPSLPATSALASGPLVLVIPSEIMGRGDEELGSILIRGFFHTLGEVEPVPDKVIFFNSGVKLVIEDSPVLEDLQALVARGVEILACGTCLGHYGLTARVAVGEVSNMYTIAETMLGAGRVVSL